MIYLKIQFNKNGVLKSIQSNNPNHPKKNDFVELIGGIDKRIILVNNHYGKVFSLSGIYDFSIPHFLGLCIDKDGDYLDRIHIQKAAKDEIVNFCDWNVLVRNIENFCFLYFGEEEPHFGGYMEIVDCEDTNLPVFCNSNRLYYSDYSGCFYLNEENTPEFQEREEEEEEEEDDRNYYTNDYHSDSSDYFDEDIYSRFHIGFEIEKEDSDVKESISIYDFKEKLPKWRKERDGSLDDYSGYELISPIFPMDLDLIENHIKSSSILMRHINADFSNSCGGHINVSDSENTPEDLYDNLSGYFSILYALYPNRIHGTYSKGYSKNYMKKEGGKRLAINLKNDRIELRIFPAVRSVKNLLFRLRVVEFMLKNPAYSLFEVNFDALNIILHEIHDTHEKKQSFMIRVNKYEKVISEQLTLEEV
jgi:hypothetical protein